MFFKVYRELVELNVNALNLVDWQVTVERPAELEAFKIT